MYNVLDQHPLYFKYGQVFEMAKSKGALLIFAEHRFYGNSYPKEEYEGHILDSSFPLSWITIDNILADYAHLLSTVKFKYNAEVSPVIVTGTDYGGLLATWFHRLYENSKLSIGSLAFYSSDTNYLLPTTFTEIENAENRRNLSDKNNSNLLEYEDERQQPLLNSTHLPKESQFSWKGQKLWAYQVCSDRALWSLGSAVLLDNEIDSSIGHYCERVVNSDFVTNTWDNLSEKNLLCQFNEKESGRDEGITTFQIRQKKNMPLYNLCGRSYFISLKGSHLDPDTILDINIAGIGKEVLVVNSSLFNQTDSNFEKTRLENISTHSEERKLRADFKHFFSLSGNTTYKSLPLSLQNVQDVTKGWIDESYMRALRYVHYQADE